MANDVEVTDLDLGRRVLRKRADLLLKELASLKRRVGEESIHDTRVQSRRLRAALEIFRDLFPKRPCNALYDSVRHITKTLGTAREVEVMLASLRNLTRGGDMAENLCREHLEIHLEEEFQGLRKKMKKGLRKVGVRPLRSQTETLLSHLSPEDTPGDWPAPASDPHASRKQRRKKRPACAKNQPSLFPLHESTIERSKRVLEELAAPVLAFRSQRDFRRASDERLHRLRLQVKKLRYAMEIFNEAGPGSLAIQISLARELQEAAGRHQDWCVLRDRIRKEVRRLNRQSSTHLAFQMNLLLARTEERKCETRESILPALTAFQAGLQPLLEDPAGLLAGQPERQLIAESKK